MGYFIYGEKETEYLKSKDKRLAEVIGRVGHVNRECIDDLFEAVVHSIVGQQISTKAHETVWKKIKDAYGKLSADTLRLAGRDKLQSLGISFRKADYIMEFADRVHSGEFDLEAVKEMEDGAAISALSSLKGIGVWTAEMILLFCLQRPDILSYGDFAIQRGMRMVYHHREIKREKFEMYRRRLSPYCSAASLYFWAVAGGALPDMRDYAPKKKSRG